MVLLLAFVAKQNKTQSNTGNKKSLVLAKISSRKPQAIAVKNQGFIPRQGCVGDQDLSLVFTKCSGGKKPLNPLSFSFLICQTEIIITTQSHEALVRIKLDHGAQKAQNTKSATNDTLQPQGGTTGQLCGQAAL